MCGGHSERGQEAFRHNDRKVGLHREWITVGGGGSGESGGSGGSGGLEAVGSERVVVGGGAGRRLRCRP